ncbi:dihydroorotate dehydrogenase (fumarate) [Thermus arciformis]|uniref:Dihydroorotate dehydrogenase (Fumarate) n=1 Tax=Thermus arciformis TaxID=482827 RepID=A0A1G7F1G0_9DEIN|nr:dihydroorotate dehydrogenase-like protein [Thermus arciformis]SDE69682.1 dihydroorotate dehydrogenase (fumarate) [Thermus arciformis]
MDLRTTYLGLELAHPLVASASPYTEKLEGFLRLEDGGAAAIVMHSLFEEQVTLEEEMLDHYLHYGHESYAEALSYFPRAHEYRLTPERHLDLLARAKERVSVPIIASLNGVSRGGWVEYARLFQEAGADALELNLYYIPTDPALSGAEVEAMYLDTIRAVVESVAIPVAVKVGHAFTAFAHFAKGVEATGAKALVLFNRFYQPDFDLETLSVVPTLTLSRPYEVLLRLHWVALLYGRVNLELALTGGVHSGKEAAKALLAGAQVAMMTSAILEKGPRHFQTVLAELEAIMEEKGYGSVAEMRGAMSYGRVAEPAAFERANYLKVLGSYRLLP